jgi:predicted  nucleic acid-binding Zn-ribbon protein
MPEQIPEQYSQDPLIERMQSIEEKQRLLKDRMVLISQNLIDFKEKQDQEITEIKKNLSETMKKITRIVSIMETISSETENFAKKSDMEILKKQAKIFQPLEFIRKEELKRYLKNGTN